VLVLRTSTGRRFARFCPESSGQPGKNTESVGSLRGGLCPLELGSDPCRPIAALEPARLATSLSADFRA
jgi:hypothetical protein